MNTDERWMFEALALAERGRGNVAPNPLVGAVVVKNGKVVGRGYHARFGRAHAEKSALLQAKEKARGATLYVTLEPCSHFGKTPPCTGYVIDFGIKRAVVAMKDPNPIVNGKGLRKLKKAGIAVETGVLAGLARRQNESYCKFITTRMPFVLLKLSSTLDGKIATENGESRWVSSYEGRVFSHRLRKEMDAILVGAGTILRDNPKLTTRLVDGRNPVRVVLDADLRIPLTAAVLKGRGKIIVFTGQMKNKPAAKVRRLEKMGVELIGVRRDFFNKKYLRWNDILKELGKRSISSLIVEGGAMVASSALDAGIVDKIAIVYDPKILGVGKAFSDGIRFRHLSEAFEVESGEIRCLGRDFLFEGYLCSRG